MHAPLPVHPLTGLTAVGWRKARPGEDEGELYPVWPILGGAPDEDDDQDDDGTDDNDDGEDDGQDDADGGAGDGGGNEDEDDADPEGADQLGDKGKRALASMKGKWRSERDKRRDLERQLANKDKGGGDDAVAKATAAATAAANTRIVKAEIRAAAAKKLADPRDALKFLDLEQFEVDADGEVDAEEIADAIETLIKDKPYLAAATGRRFQGSGDGGAARKAGRPKQLTQRDLKNMTPDQIVKAQNDGRLDDLLGPG
ncbi:hypothetical protein PV729_46730 [Streptomyces europaeiscabiei]|uniref:EF-hand domain-containing protein n=1 Tax=Streptomyces europaeiscabiei TaxID=146819 RepID=A0ABU4NA60_9ACTN|nr:hypothetical protein [Streptomyces europaeiscabiei]MDX3559063.1 hypothetical protein [Streptomyces europaeiscabiei]MDX3699638.1 hypothetical protein [Streptomyces europaeiscabiei]